jgi:anti-sigma factor RsiW
MTGVPSGREEHMDDVKLSMYLDQRLSPEERAAADAHLAACNACRDEVVALSRLLQRQRRPRRIATAAVLAAAAVVAIVLIPSVWRTPVGDRDQRGNAGTTDIRAYGPIGEAAGPAPQFVWGAVAGAVSYRLTVSGANGATVWSGSTADTFVVLPDSVVLRRDSSYLWVADALLEDGGARSTGMHEFQIAP